jgi:hypothetical protein
MAQAIKIKPDEALKINPDEYKEDLRLELLILLDEFKRLGSGAVAEIKKILGIQQNVRKVQLLCLILSCCKSKRLKSKPKTIALDGIANVKR